MLGLLKRHYAECHYAECHYAECHYAECHYAECRGANKRWSMFFLTILAHFDAATLSHNKLKIYQQTFILNLLHFSKRNDHCAGGLRKPH